MKMRKSAILTLGLVLIFAGSLYAQQAQRPAAKDIRPPVVVPVDLYDSAFAQGADISLRAAIENQSRYVYWSWLNSSVIANDQRAEIEKKQLRRQWQDLLGVDVFMPYFKMKEAEDFISDRTKVTVFNMKGKAHFNESKKQVEYIFKKKF
ncbi:MAG: hypothetical protein PHS64_00745 [Candidatus Omnitrophica bacterium]|nr:hypothetical protein [Candidatus Omnitrophota bacterium]MDD4940468.1 hypothetical protein [Candidatus Omnitrophota bacterium]MDD5774450.1 hypothetical protein [Candidatus Omnitrophota bacterium]HNQ50998.1 hypothetical protein [Candidatus Omnitrophota bacterium]HQO38788.1 hypothetical protein [Candidatus Omnitrophota bacterium]